MARLSDHEVPPAQIITLIHGTFATEADWTKPDSKLYRILKTSLNDSIILVPFNWSGQNSHAARIEASQELVKHIKKLHKKYPESTQSIVAHSHGGNVALYALRNKRAKEQVKSIICLATPFIHCSPRDIEPSVTILAGIPGGLAAIGSVVAWFALAVWLQNISILDFDHLGWQTLLIPFWSIATFLVPVFVFWSVYLFIFNIVSNRLNEKQNIHKKILSLPRAHHTKIFALRFSGDEARRYLHAITQVGSTPFWIFHIFYYPLIWLIDLASWFVKQNPSSAVYAYIPATALAIAMLPLWLVMVIVHLLLRRHKFGFGEQLIEGLLLQVSVHEIPPDYIKAEEIKYIKGKRESVVERERQPSKGAQHGLLHSLIYNDEKVALDIVKILKESL